MQFDGNFHVFWCQLYDKYLHQAQQSLVDETEEQAKIDYYYNVHFNTVQLIIALIRRSDLFFYSLQLIFE